MENSELEKFKKYFNDDIDAIKIELEKSKEYSSLIDNEIDKLRSHSNSGFSQTTTRGVQHYLIEHLKNAVSLQSQRQSLRKDLFSIKKVIMDYANKAEMNNMTEKDSKSLIECVNNLLHEQEKLILSNRKKQSSEKLDEEIEKILEKYDEEEENK